MRTVILAGVVLVLSVVKPGFELPPVVYLVALWAVIGDIAEMNKSLDNLK